MNTRKANLNLVCFVQLMELQPSKSVYYGLAKPITPHASRPPACPVVRLSGKPPFPRSSGSACTCRQEGSNGTGQKNSTWKIHKDNSNISRKATTCQECHTDEQQQITNNIRTHIHVRLQWFALHQPVRATSQHS